MQVEFLSLPEMNHNTKNFLTATLVEINQSRIEAQWNERPVSWKHNKI